MKKFVFLGMFGLVFLMGVSFAWAPANPLQAWMAGMWEHTHCGVMFSASAEGSSLLERAYGYAATMGYSPEELQEIEDSMDALVAHDAQLFEYMNNNQYSQFTAELASTNTDLVAAKGTYGRIMKEYVGEDHSRISEVVSDYEWAHMGYLACEGGPEPPS